MITIAEPKNFHEWCNAVRSLIARGIEPSEVVWRNGGQLSLFGGEFESQTSPTQIRVPKRFMELAAIVACFNDAARWPLLYRIMYRIKHGESDLLEFASDADVREAYLMKRSVNRDIHKFHAFVRFRSVKCDLDEIFVAWHSPDHWTVELATPFFARRFGSMRFSILTPKGCAHWDLKKLTFSPGVTRDQNPNEDAFEDYWLAYYRSIFNPFRLKEKAMKREFPVRHWPTLPESRLIPGMIEGARGLRSDRDDQYADVEIDKSYREKKWQI